MSNYSSSRRGPRSQGGGRRRRPSSGGPRKSARPTPSAPTKAPKVGFFQKLLGLFGLGKSKVSKKHTSKSGHPENRTEGGRERHPSKSRVSRKPERVEVTSPRLYIGNLSFDATESDLFELFSGVGQVQNVELVANRETHRSKGFGFIQMTTLDEAKRAVDELHDKEYMGRKLVVSGAKALPEMRSERPAAPAPFSEPASEPETCCGGHGETHCHGEAAEHQVGHEVAHEATHEGDCCNHERAESSESCNLY
ncbi:MAG: RNA-binding protein [Verrucomicrobia bacterium]|nr:RNA-binding protein [Verrucomicrobiota bacterium]